MPTGSVDGRCRQPETCLKKRKNNSIVQRCRETSAITSAGTSTRFVAMRRTPSPGGPSPAAARLLVRRRLDQHHADRMVRPPLAGTRLDDPIADHTGCSGRLRQGTLVGECWFREVSDKRIRRGTFRSVEQQLAAVAEFMPSHNAAAEPSVRWTKDDANRSEVARARAALNRTSSDGDVPRGPFRSAGPPAEVAGL